MSLHCLSANTHLVDHLHLWNAFNRCMSEDLTRQGQGRDKATVPALIELELFLQNENR